ncbi:MAG TPA: FAD-dependent oxidoreductase [Cytophagales bacterium]|nr:FAD-dependent oxidoreductase [Cytophagales bacterium]HAA21209.1 FAD-dependent oxidoreductase [Cytophagales bacterium]HAP60256.1 FAD-dependent oxidoreductase [Cytophagales bacterium]
MGYDVVIVGGGLAGLTNSLVLAKSGLSVLVVEKKAYPFHRVCGEYISNEVLPFLKSMGAYPEELEPAQLKRFQLTSVAGKQMEMPLDLGGWGISRYALDEFLYRRALELGVTFRLKTQVEDVHFQDNQFEVVLAQGDIIFSPLVIGAFGKRSKVDKVLDRQFIQERSDYIGVKYHIRTEFPGDVIALHNFAGGYCGLSKVEGERYNMCYLGSRKHLRQYGSIEAMEEAVVKRNPYLKQVYENSEFLFEKPEVINEINFKPKAPVEGHILMSGDSAGLITPLCGNGMALAIHSAKLLSELILTHYSPKETWDREVLETEYAKVWKKHFALRLWAGRKIQRLFGGESASNLAVNLGKRTPWVARRMMAQTHGKPF